MQLRGRGGETENPGKQWFFQFAEIARHAWSLPPHSVAAVAAAPGVSRDSRNWHRSGPTQ